MFRNKATLLMLMILPFILGSSNPLPTENDQFSINNQSVFSPGTEASVSIYTSLREKTDFKLTLLRIEDVKSFYEGLLSSNYNFDIIGKEILFKYTRKIKEWNETILPDYNYNTGNVHLGKIYEPGVYIVQALRGKMVAYCSVVITDYAIVYKTTRSEILAFTQNVKSGEFLKNVTFTYLFDNEPMTAKSDSSGIGLIKIKPQKDQRFTRRSLLLANTDKEILISNPYLYWGRQRDIAAYTYTNQPVYRPGQQVFFKSILREKSGNDLKNVAGEVFNVTVKSPSGKEMYNKDLTTNEAGALWGDLILDEDAALGNYSIYLRQGESSFYGSFSVEEYKKPEYEVRVNIPETNYSNGDVIDGTVNAAYYFGSPVSKGTVKVNIYKQNYWRPWWYFSEYSWFYKNYQRPGYYNWQEMLLINTVEGTLDENGDFKFSYEVKESVDADFSYTIIAEVVDASRRSIQGSATALITRGSFGLFTSTDQYFIEQGKPVIIKVNAADFNNKPVKTDFKVVFSYPDKHGRIYDHDFYSYRDSLIGRTDDLGKAVLTYMPKFNTNGYFNYVVSAKDEKGRLITSHGSFYYGERWYYNYSWGEGVQIITDKDTYKKGDSLTAYVFLPDSSTEFLLSYEANDIFYYKKEFAQGNSITIKEKLDERFAPSFNISVTYMKNGKFYNFSKPVGVLDEEKFLKVTITPDKKLYKPADNATYVISIKDYYGRPVPKTDVSVGLIDEAIYSIQEESVQDITSFFYAPVYSWVAANNSYYYNYSSGQSRKVNAIDKYFFDTDKKNEKGSGNVHGKALNTPTEKLTGCEIVLLNEDNFYSTSVDTGGNYRFSNIVKGTYHIMVYSADGVIYQTEDVEITKDSKYDILINSMIFSPGVRGGRSNDVMISANRVIEQKSIKVIDGDAMSMLPAVKRSNFVDAAFWAPSLISDNDGKVTVNFKMPDNLTKWRTTVRGITAGSFTGQDTIKTITRKDLIIRMETPRFFREGDELTISTIVHNYLDQKKRTKINFKSASLKLLESQINTPGYSTNLYDQKAGMYELTIEKNTELRIDWRVLVTAGVDTITLYAEALTDKESDAIELKVQALPKGLKRVMPVIAELGNKNEELVNFNIPEGVDLKSAKFSFNTAPSLSGTMLKALDELAGYPYGCVEQTMSRFLPTIIATNAFNQIKVPLKSSTISELPKMVNEGLKKLYAFQHQDNGWGWWNNDESSPYMTAYVVYGLSLCKAAGYPVNESVLNRGIERLSTQFNATHFDGHDSDETTLAYMIYSLSTAAKGKYDEMLLKKISGLHKDKLNPYSLSLITLALLNLDQKKEAEACALILTAKASTEGGMTLWKRGDWNYYWQSDEVQTTAYALKALINVGAKSELISNGVKWLLMQRRGFCWRSTQETASIIFMLTDYLKQTNELEPDYNVKVFLNDQLAYEKRITGEDVYREPELIRQKANLKTGTNTIRIVKDGPGKVYFSGVNEYFTQETNASGRDAKFNVVRDYFLLKPIQSNGRIIYKKEYLDSKDDIKSGDDILVKTTVTSTLMNPQYFILEDMLPSGIEVVKDVNKYEIEGENDYRSDDYWGGRSWRWHYADREYRDEKVAFFVTYGSQKMEFSYIIKAQIPGSYNIMPSQASLMYYPEINGNSNGYQTVIKDK